MAAKRSKALRGATKPRLQSIPLKGETKLQDVKDLCEIISMPLLPWQEHVLKDMLTVETRGMNMIQALTRHKLDSGNYPESLEKLVPQFAPAVSKCPNGSNSAYKLAAAALSCTAAMLRCTGILTCGWG